MKRILIAVSITALIIISGYAHGAWNTGIPKVTNNISSDIPKMQQNFQYLYDMIKNHWKGVDNSTTTLSKDNFYFVDSDCSDQGVAGCSSTRSVKDIIDACSGKYCTMYFPHRMTSTNTNYQFQTGQDIQNNITVMVEQGALLDTSYSVTDGGSAWTWTLHSGKIYKLDQTISAPVTVYESGTSLTQVADKNSFTGSSQWAWDSSKLYVRTSGDVDPDTLASGTIEAGVEVTFYRFDVPPYQVFTGYGVPKFAAGHTIFGEWFGSDLSKAYSAATTGSLITYFSDQILSSAITMTKAGTSIMGSSPGIDISVKPTFTGTAAIVYGSATASTTDLGWNSIRNMYLDCDNKTDNGIFVYGSYFGTLENIYIKNTLSDAIKFYLSGTSVWSRITLRNITTWASIGRCINITNLNNENLNAPNSISVEHFTCWQPRDSGVYLWAADGYPMAVSFKDLWLEGVGRHGIESYGRVYWSVDEGFVEWNPNNSPGAPDNSTLYGIYMATDPSTWKSGIGGFGSIHRFSDQWTNPYVGYLDTLVVDDCFLQGNAYRGSKYTLGHRSNEGSSVLNSWSGIREDLKMSSGQISDPDYFGNRWLVTHGSDNASKTTDKQFRSLDFPIKTKFTYADANGTVIWYPTENFIIKDVILQGRGDWSCTAGTVVSLGTSGGPNNWIFDHNETTLNSSYYNPIHGEGWVLVGSKYYLMDGYSTGGSLHDYNYIAVYFSGGTCSAGTGYIAIDGYYPDYIPLGATP